MKNIINSIPEASHDCLYDVSVCITYAHEKYAFIRKYGVTRKEVLDIIHKYRVRYADIKVSAYHHNLDDALHPSYEFREYMVITTYIRQALRDAQARKDAKELAIKYHNSYSTYRDQFLNDVMLFHADNTGIYNI